jgi:hypothetical protein
LSLEFGELEGAASSGTEVTGEFGCPEVPTGRPWVHPDHFIVRAVSALLFRRGGVDRTPEMSGDGTTAVVTPWAEDAGPSRDRGTP